MLTYRALHGSAAPYFASSFTIADMPHRCRLKSAATERLDVPTCRRSTVGGRAFPVAGGKVWNGLPSDVKSVSSLAVFKNWLKTYLFRRCYETVWLWMTLTFPQSLRSLQYSGPCVERNGCWIYLLLEMLCIIKVKRTVTFEREYRKYLYSLASSPSQLFLSLVSAVCCAVPRPSQSCTPVQIFRLDPTDESRDPTRPVNLCSFGTRHDPIRRPIHNGESCKTNKELNVYSLLCAHYIVESFNWCQIIAIFASLLEY